MNLEYWGAQVPVADSVEGSPYALPILDLGQIGLVDADGPQVIAIADDAVDTLTVPDGAIYAKLQVNGGAAWYSTDGTDPVIATGNGYKVADLAIIELWGYDQMSKFKVRAHTGATGKVYVEYKKYKKRNRA